MEPPTLAEDSVPGLPMEGKAGSGMGVTPSQMAPPKGAEGGNLLLPALNSQDGVIREESVSSGVNAERATTPSLNYQASMTKRSAGMWINWIAITLISIIEVIFADLHYGVICADQLYSLARQLHHIPTRTSARMGSNKNARGKNAGRTRTSPEERRSCPYLCVHISWTSCCSQGNLNRERARGYTSIRPGAPSREPGYAHMHSPQRIYDAAFVRGSARPARCQGARIQPLSTGVPSKSLRAYAHARYRG